jgi:hypothetical protein
MDQVDGFTVQRIGEVVVIILSNRYGDSDQYELTVPDARKIGEALILSTENDG